MHTPNLNLRAPINAARATIVLLSLLVALFLSHSSARADDVPYLFDWPPGPKPPAVVTPTLPDSFPVGTVGDTSSLARFAAWTRFVLISMRDGTTDIYLSNADGSSIQRVTNSADVEARAVLHPDGKRIGFDADYDGDGKREIWIVNVDGTGLRRLTYAGGDNWGPAFSSDWSRVAYTSNRSGNMDIYAMDIDTGVEYQVTDSPKNEFDPEWFPGAQSIYFVVQVEWINSGLLHADWSPGEGRFNVIGSIEPGHAQYQYLQRPRFNHDGSKLLMSSVGLSGTSYYFSSVIEYQFGGFGGFQRVFASYNGVEVLPGGYIPVTLTWEPLDIPIINSLYYSDHTPKRKLLGASFSLWTYQKGILMGSTGFDIGGTWAATDTTPPVIAASPAPSYLTSAQSYEYKVKALDENGIDAYVFEINGGNDPHWYERYDEDGTLGIGPRMQLRAKARDLAGNWSEWTPVHMVFMYSHYMSGNVIDVRGYPMANVVVNISQSEGGGSDDSIAISRDDGHFSRSIYAGHETHYLRPYLQGYSNDMSARRKRAAADPAKADPAVPNTYANLVLALPEVGPLDGGFEPSATITDSWELSGGASFVAREPYHSFEGIYAGYGSLHLSAPESSARFTATVPADMRQPTLSLMWLPTEPEAPVSIFAQIETASALTTTIELSPSVTLRDDTWDWRLAWTDLAPYAGETITVTLHAQRPYAVKVNLDAVRISSWSTPVIEGIEHVAGAEGDTEGDTEGEVADATATPITIHGQNFIQPVKLYYGSGTQLKPLAVTYVDENTVRFTPPANLAPGIYRLLLANQAGSDAEAYAEVATGLRSGIQVALPMVQFNR